jgi:hypothetical protein
LQLFAPINTPIEAIVLSSVPKKTSEPAEELAQKPISRLRGLFAANTVNLTYMVAAVEA